MRLMIEHKQKKLGTIKEKITIRVDSREDLVWLANQLSQDNKEMYFMKDKDYNVDPIPLEVIEGVIDWDKVYVEVTPDLKEAYITTDWEEVDKNTPIYKLIVLDDIATNLLNILNKERIDVGHTLDMIEIMRDKRTIVAKILLADEVRQESLKRARDEYPDTETIDKVIDHIIYEVSEDLGKSEY